MQARSGSFHHEETGHISCPDSGSGRLFVRIRAGFRHLLKRDLALAECTLLAVQNNRDLATGPIGAGPLLISTKKWKSLLISHTGLVFSR